MVNLPPPAGSRKIKGLTVLTLTYSILTMKITSKGQITIPQNFREELGFLPHTDVEFVKDKAGLRLVRTKGKRRRGDRLIDQMRGRGDGKLSTDEIMAMTGAALEYPRGQQCAAGYFYGRSHLV